MIKVILYILTLFVVAWLVFYLCFGAAFAGVGNFYIPVIIIGGVLLPILIFHQMYHLNTPRKMKILWIGYFLLLLILCGVCEIMINVRNRSVPSEREPYSVDKKAYYPVSVQKLDSCIISDSFSLSLYEVEKSLL